MRFGVVRATANTASPEDLVFPVEHAQTVVNGQAVMATFDHKQYALLYARAMLSHRDAVHAGHVAMVCTTCKSYCHKDTFFSCLFCGLSLCPSRECELFHGHNKMSLV